MPPLRESNIRVSIHYKQATIFAGEEIEATITFANIAPPPPSPLDRFKEPNWDAQSGATGPASYAGGERERGKKPVPGGVGRASGVGERPGLARQLSLSHKRGISGSEGRGGVVPQHLRGKGEHTRGLSLSTGGLSGGHSAGGRAVSGPGGAAAGHGGVQAAQHPARPRHGRTLSILSLGTDAGEQRQPTRGHGRASSVQIPRRAGSATPGGLSRQASPLIGATSPGSTAAGGKADENQFPSVRPSPLSPNNATQLPSSNRGSPQPAEFTFPASSESGTETKQRPQRQRSPKPPDLQHMTRLMSDTSINGTPRSSGEFYSQTNHSSETLASEYMQQPPNRWFTKPEAPLGRTASLREAGGMRSAPETLMMGYAQVMGSFSVDGSLINQAPFEEVKRKGIIGTQGGGGVVGLERSKRESGLFGALGWGNIGESLSGILGGGELSSIKEMRGAAKDRNIPLLSTPQSILFVDLRLAPGESRSYSYCFKLPRGLPPTHKGRAIKLSYWITIGVQRPAAGKEGGQHVKSVDVPFRVLGSVNGHGEVLGHDLMSPYIILRDEARTAASQSPSSEPATAKAKAGPKRPVNGAVKPPEDEGLADFHNYVTSLLSRSHGGDDQAPPSALLSPTSEVPPLLHRRRHSSFVDEPASMKEAIDFAILRSGQLPVSKNARSTTRFEIARSGLRVAVVTISRPAFRLGDTIHLSLDFSAAAIPTYAATVSLETAETVDPSLALRSASSIARVTRKVHAACAGNVVFASRVGVSLGVPWSAVPELLTTGVRVGWKVRVEFTGPKLEVRRRSEAVEEPPPHQHRPPLCRGGGGEDEGGGKVDEEEEDADDEKLTIRPRGKAAPSPEIRLDFPKLLNEASKDHRGSIARPVERLQCDSFEVEVPIRVYGAVVEVGEGKNFKGLVV